jgi:hypothetical protein
MAWPTPDDEHALSTNNPDSSRYVSTLSEVTRRSAMAHARGVSRRVTSDRVLTFSSHCKGRIYFTPIRL